MNSLSSVLKKSGHDIYENIIQIVVLSVLSSLIMLPGFLLLPVQFGIVYLMLIGVPSMAGVIYAMDHKIKRKHFKYMLFFKGLKKYYFKALILGLLTAFLILIPVSSFWYFAKARTTLNFIIAMFQLYLCGAIFTALIYTLPLMVCGDNNISQSIKKSFKLFVDNIAYSLGSLIQIIAVGGLLAVTVISIPMLFAGMLSVFIINLYDNLLLKYEEQEKERREA